MMKIIVLAKQVPDTTEIKIDKENGTLIRAGIPSIINPDDQAAIEAALELKDSQGAHVTVVTMGPLQAEGMLREIIAMGADEAVLVTDRKFAGADTKATSYTLASTLRGMEYDLIIAGRQAIDGDTAQVGPQVAEQLGLPQITYVDQIKMLNSEKIVVRKSLESTYEVLEAKLPCLITTLSEMNTLRYVDLTRINMASTCDVKVITTEDLNIDLKQIGLAGSPTKVKRTYTKEISTTASKYEVEATEAAKMIVETLLSKHLIA